MNGALGPEANGALGPDVNGALAAESLRALPARVRSRWRRDALMAGLAGASLVLAAAVAGLLALDRAIDLAAGWRTVLRWLPLVLAAPPAAVTWRRARALRDERRAALLLEERVAGVDHLLTTALEADLSGPVGEAVRRRARERLATIRVQRVVPYTFGRVVAWAAATLLVSAGLLAAAPGGPAAVWARWARPSWESQPAAADRPGAGRAATPAGSVGGAALAPALTAIQVRVTPPGYTGLPPREEASDGVLAALAGSHVSVGVLATGGILAARRATGEALDAVAVPGGWTVSWVLEPGDRGVDLALLRGAGDTAVADRRVVPIAVVEDRPPEVTLELPRADLVVATASGVIRVRARATDDFGVGDWDLHWVRSSGSGESFSFEEGRWAWDGVSALGDTLVADFALDLATTGLGAGDVLHLRAEARDRNDVTGPGLGVSATRLVRVAEPDALDEVTTLVGFPIEREREPILSQRMIILLTEELLEQAATLDEEAFRERSARIADEQDRLRERVEEAVFVRAGVAEEDPEPSVADAPPTPAVAPPIELPGHDHDGNPVLAVNPDLLEAFNAMWEASRLLRQAEPAPSLPPQHRALARLQRVREAERVYARGRVTRPPLDLDAARGTGKVDEAAPVPRSAGEAAPDGARWRGEVEAVAETLSGGGRGAAEVAALALRLQGLAAAVLAAPDGSVGAAAAIERAARRVAAGAHEEARALLAEAAAALTPGAAPGLAPPLPAASDGRGGAYLAALVATGADGADARAPTEPAATTPPFVFATARYGSGDWDSAPLVPSNLVHSLAQYTDLPVEDQGVVVDLASPELLRYPFVFLTGHLPVRLDEAESEGVRRYVERGGFLFIDDHNHDIDGGFHRSVLSELARIFGPDALRPLPEDHELYRSFFVFEEGPPITGHELSGWGDGLIHRELFAISVGGRIGVLYSNKDYSSEWSYHAENKRFLAQDNTRFGVNVILYALSR